MEGKMTSKEQAYEAGTWARQEGRTIASRPMYGSTEECAELRKEWERGFKDEDARRKRK